MRSLVIMKCLQRVIIIRNNYYSLHTAIITRNLFRAKISENPLECFISLLVNECLMRSVVISC